MEREEIPGPAVERLSLLYRFLEERTAADGPLVSSARLEELTGIPAHTIRKDISYLDEEPGKGAGYDPASLRELIRRNLGLGRVRNACIVGLGRLGSALLAYSGFSGGEFRLAAGFDTSMNRIELLRTDVPLYPAHELERVIERERIELGIIAVPARAARETARRMIDAGVRGIINFAPVMVGEKKDGVFVRNISVLGELTVLSALIAQDDATRGSPEP